MKRMSIVAVVALLPVAAFAQMSSVQERSTNFEIGLRAAYAIPFGKATDAAGDDLNQTIKHDIPLTLDLNYRFSQEVYGGLYFSYGFGALGDPVASACASGASCSANTLRLGLQVAYHFSPRRQYDPWMGLSIGYEQTKVSASGPGGSRDATISGLEIANVQGGVDFRPSPLFALGPFVSAGVGEFTHIDAGSTSGGISNTALHGWIGLGVRMSFTP